MSDALMVALGISLASLGATGLGVLVCVLVWRKMTTIRVDPPIVVAHLEDNQANMHASMERAPTSVPYLGGRTC